MGIPREKSKPSHNLYVTNITYSSIGTLHIPVNITPPLSPRTQYTQEYTRREIQRFRLRSEYLPCPHGRGEHPLLCCECPNDPPVMNPTQET